MNLGIMQPYFFPYLGYWQLMNAVDTYVIFDDVAYINGGWIKRNQIKMNGRAQRIGISIKHASQNKKINELYLVEDIDVREKLLRTLEEAYRKAPYYADAMSVAERAMRNDKENLAEFLADSIYMVADYLGIKSNFIISSSLEKDETLRAQNRVLDICSRLNADVYINAIGGRELYSKEAFRERGIQLNFLEMHSDIVYPQGKGEFIPNLSILDVMMYNSQEDIQAMLQQYSLY